jgi:uncharacterized lipoprotein YajG
MKFSSLGSLTFANRLKVVVIAAAALVLPGCSDNGPPPDETAKNAPPAPSKEPDVKKKGAPVKLKSIKDRS